MRASRDDEDRPCEKHLMLIIQTVVFLTFVGLVKCEYTCGIEKRCIDQKAVQRSKVFTLGLSPGYGGQ
jgi:hypothetical protein